MFLSVIEECDENYIIKLVDIVKRKLNMVEKLKYSNFEKHLIVGEIESFLTNSIQATKDMINYTGYRMCFQDILDSDLTKEQGERINSLQKEYSKNSFVSEEEYKEAIERLHKDFRGNT
jgi:hypothetical protein